MKNYPIVKHFYHRRIKILPNTLLLLKNAPKTYKFVPNLLTLITSHVNEIRKMLKKNSQSDAFKLQISDVLNMKLITRANQS